MPNLVGPTLVPSPRQFATRQSDPRLAPCASAARPAQGRRSPQGRRPTPPSACKAEGSTPVAASAMRPKLDCLQALTTFGQEVRHQHTTTCSLPAASVPALSTFRQDVRPPRAKSGKICRIRDQSRANALEPTWGARHQVPRSCAQTPDPAGTGHSATSTALRRRSRCHPNAHRLRKTPVI